MVHRNRWFTMVYQKKWVDFPWQTVSHNQRVFQRYFRNTSCWMIIWYYLPKCCGAKPKKNKWLGCRSRSLRDGPQSMTWIPCSALQPFPMMFGFPFPWCLAFIVLPTIKHNFPFPLFFSQWFDASRPGPKNHEHFGRRARCTSVVSGFFFS